MSKTVLPAAWKVPELFAARLGDTAGRQRAMASDGHLLLVLHEPPGPDDAERRGRLFWREPNGSWKSNSLGAGVQAVRKHLAEFADRIEAMEDQFQQATGADDYFRVLQAIAPLYRTARNMHSTLQQARELVRDDRDLIVLRDQAGEIERTAELLHGDAKNGLDFTVARQAEEQARRGYEMAISAHRLNLLAAIFFPIATLSSVFGMNLPHGLDRPLTFWIVLAIGMMSGILLTAVVAQRPGAERRPPQRRRVSPHRDPFQRPVAAEIVGASPPPAPAASQPAARRS